MEEKPGTRMILFILDDSFERLKAFRRACHPSWSVVTAASYAEAVERAKGQRFDAMFLDHDLNNEEEGSTDLSRINCGSNFAEWLVDNYSYDCPIIIHTLNPVGGENMKKILETKFSRVFYMPFAWQKVREIVK